MKVTSFFIRLKPSVELKKVSRKSKKYSSQSKIQNRVFTLQSQCGGGLGVIFIGLAAILVAFVIFINIADYSLYTYKRNAISKAMDYAVTAAVQQINKSQSIVGVSNGFTEETGESLLEGVEIDADVAYKTFLAVFYSNHNLDNLRIENNLLVCATSARDGKLNYTIETDTEVICEGTLENNVLIEERINQAVNQLWPTLEDNSQVYIAGNPKTNMIENGTYLFAFLKDIKITGIYSQRQISLSSFAGAKIER